MLLHKWKEHKLIEVLKEEFEKMAIVDTYIDNIIEEYIYSTVSEYYEDGEF